MQPRVPEGDVRRDVLQHVDDRLVHLEEDAVVQLPEAEELQNLARLRGELVDTNDTRAEDELRLRPMFFLTVLISVVFLSSFWQIWRGPLLAVSKLIFSSKCSFESS